MPIAQAEFDLAEEMRKLNVGPVTRSKTKKRHVQEVDADDSTDSLNLPEMAVGMYGSSSFHAIRQTLDRRCKAKVPAYASRSPRVIRQCQAHRKTSSTHTSQCPPLLSAKLKVATGENTEAPDKAISTPLPGESVTIKDFAASDPSQPKINAKFLCGHASQEVPIPRRPTEANKAFYSELCRMCQLSEIKYLESVIQEAQVAYSYRLGVRTGDALSLRDSIESDVETELFDVLCDQFGAAFGERYVARWEQLEQRRKHYERRWVAAMSPEQAGTAHAGNMEVEDGRKRAKRKSHRNSCPYRC